MRSLATPLVLALCLLLLAPTGAVSNAARCGIPVSTEVLVDDGLPSLVSTCGDSGGSGCRGRAALEGSTRHVRGDENNGGARVAATIFWHYDCGAGRPAKLAEQRGYCTWSGNWRPVSCVWDSRPPPGGAPDGGVVRAVTGTFSCANAAFCGESTHALTVWVVGSSHGSSRCEHGSSPANQWRAAWCGPP